MSPYRPRYDRLLADAPNTAPAMAMAMILRALRMLATVNGKMPDGAAKTILAIALAEFERKPDHP
jgi:hypothetical protein